MVQFNLSVYCRAGDPYEVSIVICIYDPLDTTFSGHGLAVLRPMSCNVSEVAGGSYDLTITMPITDDGKWELLCKGAVIRAPVPQVVTPLLTMKEAEGADGVAVYRVVFGSDTMASARYLSIRAEPDMHAAVLETVPEFGEIVYTGETDDSGDWMQFIAPSGACGWAPYWYVEYVCPYVPGTTDGGVIEERQVRDQLFRIHNVNQSEDGTSVTAAARHISYDQMYNPVHELMLKAPTPAATACSRLMAEMENQNHSFRILAGVDGRLEGTWSLINGVNALLDPVKGFAALLRARVVRDNFDFFLLPNTEDAGGISIRYGKNLIGVGVSLDDDAVYTRFIPLGKDTEGNPLRLPEGCIDSQHIGEYAFPRIMMWEVSGAQVGVKRTLEDGSEVTLDAEGVYELMRKAVQEKLEACMDEPVVKVTVDFVDLAKTKEYESLAGLQNVFLYDWVTVVHGPRKLRLRRQVCGYEFDCIQERYLRLELGDVFADRTAGVI